MPQLVHARGIFDRHGVFVSLDQISATLNAVLADAFKASERTVFWDDELRANMNPFADLDGGFFAADWDLKVCHCLAMLYELPLSTRHVTFHTAPSSSPARGIAAHAFH